MKKFYITTPIYYASGTPHIGSAYTGLIADIIARYKRLKGFNVFFLTGTDEHGQKMADKAFEAGLTPKAFADKVSKEFVKMSDLMNYSYDDFIRTTDKRHVKAAQEFFQKVFENGDIYKGAYEGWYCVPCESYFTEKELVKNCCPDCGRLVKLLKEDSYFFKLSKYQNKIINHIKNNPDFIRPESRRNEVLSRLKNELRDLSVSRAKLKWGIPLPNDKSHVMYVWFDALTNYLTAIGYADDQKQFKKYWPADLHLMGKEIIWFHCVIWPAMLMSAGLPLPKQVFAHGWWTVNGDKMSKSKGNVILPADMIKKYGVDALRFCLASAMELGGDGDFTEELLKRVNNNELADELGNLVNRVLAMTKKYFDLKVPRPDYKSKEYDSFKSLINTGVADALLDKLEVQKAIKEIWLIIKNVNKYVNDNEPWALAKNKDKKLDTVIYNLLEGLRVIAGLVSPFIPETADKIKGMLVVKDFNSKLKPGQKVKQGEVLFKKID
ncbi:MAG: methionine--tRNA ligase [Candidatus Nanoarchaeia archaeon]|jgi:methionyl-tRNA synthetase